MPFDDDLPFGEPVDNDENWELESGVPVDAAGNSLIPELANRFPTHNEGILIAGMTVTMASTNVAQIWWRWKNAAGEYDPALFVRFLDGSLYSYNGPEATLSLALGMVETASPGRYVWNVLRQIWPVPGSKGTGPGTYTQHIKGNSKGRKKAQVIRIVRKNKAGKYV